MNLSREEITERKIKFIKENYNLAYVCFALDKQQHDWKRIESVSIARLAKEKLGFSKKTSLQDVYLSLMRTYNHHFKKKR